MSDFVLLTIILGAIAGLIWLQRNRHNPESINGAKAKLGGITWVTLVEKALLLCAGSMGSFFAYSLLAPINALLGFIAAVLVVAFNLAEGYVLRGAVNSFRHGNILAAGIKSTAVLMLVLYSLTAGASVISIFIDKQKELDQSYQLDLAASNQRIENAKASIYQAQMNAQRYAINGDLYNQDVLKARENAGTIAASELANQAKLLREKAPSFRIALGFDRDSIAFLMALVLELSIIGIIIYECLYISPAPLLSAVRFANKELQWNVNPHQLANLSIEKSPAPETIALPHTMPKVGFSGYGWQPSAPTVATVEVLEPSVPSVETVRTEPCVETVRAEPCVPCAHGSERTDTHGRGLDVTRRGMTLQKMAEPKRPDAGDIALAPKATQEGAFNEWLDAIKHGDIEPTVAPAKRFISERKLANGIKLIGAMANDWLDRAFNLGVLELNQEQGNGKAKYRLAGEGVK